MKELRIGLVLYGGGSMAVYMNGIVYEASQLLKASQAFAKGDADALDDSAADYHDLLTEIEACTGISWRVVVDTVAGSSAGGVNGTALAKMVTQGADGKVLNKVWIRDADISKLRAEPAVKASWCLRMAAKAAALVWSPVRKAKAWLDDQRGIDWDWALDHAASLFARVDGRRTLLDGHYFSKMIAGTIHDMTESGSGPVLLPDRASFDLFLTQTDLHGWPRHLPVDAAFHEKPLYERTHAHVMHFRREPCGKPIKEDFGLTYATRATAGFPVAFAPITHRDIVDAYGEMWPGKPIDPRADFAKQHLPEHALFGIDADHAFMVDGGLLDNRPFSYVINAIERKPADHQVYRVVMYVQPDPERDIVEHSAEAQAFPYPYEVALGLWGIFRHEPIRGDLDRIKHRNARSLEILSVIAADRESNWEAAKGAGQDAGLSLPPESGEAEKWRDVTNAYVAGKTISGYPGYVVLKLRFASYLLADLVCQQFGLPYHARQAYFVRQTLNRWLESQGMFEPLSREEGRYVVDGERLDFLKAFDIPYRERRLRHLVHVANEQFGGNGDDNDALDAFKRSLADLAIFLDRCRRPNRGLLRALLAGASDTDADDLRHAIAANNLDPESALKRYEGQIRTSLEAVTKRYLKLGARFNRKLAAAIGALPASLQEKVMKAYITFPFVDLVAYPMMASAGIEDLIDVRIMRVSPFDTTFSYQPRLAGAELGGFAGFLSPEARQADILRGRRDGADRLVSLLLEASYGSEVDPAMQLTWRERLVETITASQKALLHELDQEAEDVDPRPGPRPRLRPGHGGGPR